MLCNYARLTKLCWSHVTSLFLYSAQKSLISLSPVQYHSSIEKEHLYLPLGILNISHSWAVSTPRTILSVNRLRRQAPTAHTRTLSLHSQFFIVTQLSLPFNSVTSFNSVNMSKGTLVCAFSGGLDTSIIRMSLLSL